ncbi:MAG: hypothetical protein HN509_00105 [Halobacteriovoraceae bacterium]|nr:hypothetical protein [Halobacteriovoraceae bacterium]MBT5094177.1 hypothetical protein [Halobacteriovoraceae bacterium]
MNGNFDSENQSQPEIKIDFNINDLKLDEKTDVLDENIHFDFKPMSKGLGFHKNERDRGLFKPAAKNLKRVPRPEKQPEVVVREKTREIRIDNPLPAKSLATKGISTKGKNKKKKSKVASAEIQAIAYLLDCALIALMVMVTTGLLVAAAGINYQVILNLATPIELGVFCGTFFVLYYLLYFSLLDLFGTPGKGLMGLELVGVRNSDPTLKMTAVRSLITLFSIPLFFLPNLLDFQGKLSDSKVIKR